jgi:hypothetical protein
MLALVLALGAFVRISFLGYDDGAEKERHLNGQPVAAINANLSSSLKRTTCTADGLPRSG